MVTTDRNDLRMQNAACGYGLSGIDYEDNEKSMGACCCLCRLIDAPGIKW